MLLSICLVIYAIIPVGITASCNPSFTYFVSNHPKSMNQSDVLAATKYAFDQWQTAINRSFFHTENRKEANFTIEFSEMFGSINSFYDNNVVYFNGTIILNDRIPNWKFYRIGDVVDIGPMFRKTNDLADALMLESGNLMLFQVAYVSNNNKYPPETDVYGNYIPPKLWPGQILAVKRIW